MEGSSLQKLLIREEEFHPGMPRMLSQPETELLPEDAFQYEGRRCSGGSQAPLPLRYVGLCIACYEVIVFLVSTGKSVALDSYGQPPQLGILVLRNQLASDGKPDFGMKKKKPQNQRGDNAH